MLFDGSKGIWPVKNKTSASKLLGIAVNVCRHVTAHEVQCV